MGGGGAGVRSRSPRGGPWLGGLALSKANQRSTSNALPARVRNLGRERAPQHGTPGRTRGVELGARESLELGQVPERHLREVVVLAVAATAPPRLSVVWLSGGAILIAFGCVWRGLAISRTTLAWTWSRAQMKRRILQRKSTFLKFQGFVREAPVVVVSRRIRPSSRTVAARGVLCV